MRITLDLDDDVLRAVRELARREKKTVGRVISDLARQALGASPVGLTREMKGAARLSALFPRRGGVVTNELIDRLREEDTH